MKKPVSVLALLHTPALDVLLLERVGRADFWQSVTGSQEDDESFRQTVMREVGEETGLSITDDQVIDWHLANRFEIFAEWRHRYASGVTHNVEHVFSVTIAEPCPIRISRAEHLNYKWLPWHEAARCVFSWSNRDAILMLPHLKVVP